MRGIELFKKHNFPFGVVCVVTDVSVKHPEEIFKFFVENEIYCVKFSRLIYRDRNGKFLKPTVHPEKYGEFLLKLIDLWLTKDDPKIKFTPLSDFFRSLLQGECFEECLFSESCARFLVVNANGDIFACSSEGSDEYWKFGNIADGIAKAINSRQFKAYQDRIIEIRKRCHFCQWYSVCRGGCTCDYELMSNGSEHNALCGSFKKIFQYAKTKLSEFELI